MHIYIHTNTHTQTLYYYFSWEKPDCVYSSCIFIQYHTKVLVSTSRKVWKEVKFPALHTPIFFFPASRFLFNIILELLIWTAIKKEKRDVHTRKWCHNCINLLQFIYVTSLKERQRRENQRSRSGIGRRGYFKYYIKPTSPKNIWPQTIKSISKIADGSW